MNPLFPADKQPKPGTFQDGTVVMVSVKFGDGARGSFSFKDIKAGVPYTLTAFETMFERVVTVSQDPYGEPIKPYEFDVELDSEAQLRKDSKKKFDPADLSEYSLGTSITFPKAGEVEVEPEPLDPKTLNEREKEILKKFPKNRQGKRAALRHITHMREQEASKLLEYKSLPFDLPPELPQGYVPLFWQNVLAS